LIGPAARPPLLSPEEAERQYQEARRKAFGGDVAGACPLLAWAAVSLSHAGLSREALQASTLLAWAQAKDGRSWQAALTLRRCLKQAEYDCLTQSFRCRGHLSYAYALWDLGNYTESAEAASEARRLATTPLEAGMADIAFAQAHLYMGHQEVAEAAFDQALRTNSTLTGTIASVKAYLHNLRGEHRRALKTAEGAINTVKSSLENNDNATRAAERAALMVERGTAKAFLGHRDARQSLIEARAAICSLGGDVELEEARIKRAWAMVLIKAREPNAASALLSEANGTFRRRRVIPEQDLTAVVAGILNYERR